MLYQDRDDYFKQDEEIGIVYNNYFGFNHGVYKQLAVGILATLYHQTNE